MDLGTTLFVLGFVFSSAILLVLGFQEVWRDVSRWRAQQEHSYMYDRQHSHRTTPAFGQMQSPEQL